jgi:hypothetical protein
MCLSSLFLFLPGVILAWQLDDEPSGVWGLIRHLPQEREPLTGPPFGHPRLRPRRDAQEGEERNGTGRKEEKKPQVAHSSLRNVDQ